MKLVYVMDPMCSWCWGFRPQFEMLMKHLPEGVSVRYVMGGLAADSDAPMPEKTRQYVQSQWHAVTEKTGTDFNWDFWQHCQPRRSTYPACRAVIAAGNQGELFIPQMILAIQQAYYLQARNPSDDSVLVALADEIGLDTQNFTKDFNSKAVNDRLQADLRFARELDVRSFPTVLLLKGNSAHLLGRGDTASETMLHSMHSLLQNS